MKTIKVNQEGIAHLGLIIAAILIVAVGGLAYTRVRNANSDNLAHSSLDGTTEVIEPLPADLQDIKTLEELEQIVGATDSNNIIRFVLESEDNGYVYKVVMSNGRKLVINASTGEILSEETTDVSDDDQIPAGLKISLSLAEAYKLAASRSSSPIKSIEMEVEDKKIVYKIEYKDGSKIELNASTGSVIKAEIKDEDESEDEDEDESEDEDEGEDEDESEDEDEDESEDEDEDEDEDDN